MLSSQVRSLANFAWGIADLLRGDFKQFEYGKIILPFVVLRRLDCLLEATKDAVVSMAADLPEGIDDATKDMILFEAAGGLKVYNTSNLTLAKIKGQNPAQLHPNLIDYIRGFSSGVRDIFLEKFLFTDTLKRLNDAEILWHVFEKFTQIDLHRDAVSNLEMGYLFEDLIRRFSEMSNETAGEHFTPREVVRLIVEMLIANDRSALSGTGIIRTVYDPACGTGGMLSITEEEIKAINSRVRVELYGQELNPESYAICRSDMLVTGHDPEQIAFGNTLSADAHRGRRFHYMVSNPPYGVDWKKYADVIKDEAARGGDGNRFSAGLPRISDGQLLFLQHMISKMRDDAEGSQIGIVMNGSPLFTGGAASGESEIRRWLLADADMVEAIVALPTDIFYNTGIQTYVWLLTNRKDERRRGKVQLIDASSNRFWKSMRRSLGMKRREIHDDARSEIVQIYANMLNGGSEYSDYSKIVDVADLGYREIRVDRPLRLAFEITPERLERLALDKAMLKISEGERDAILACVREDLPAARIDDRAVFEKMLTKAFKAGGLKVPAPLKKAVINAIGRRDESAQPCLDAQGNPEPDVQLRDFELVPLKERWQDFFAREVKPFADDAWVDKGYVDARDGEIGRVGYEVNFARYFYQYTPPAIVADIDDELAMIERDIAALVMGQRS
jgi:type I restriction enzyme M protein